MMADRVLPGIATLPIALGHVPIEIARTLLRFRDDLLARFPGQIRCLILFGSQARGEATFGNSLRDRLRHDYAPDRHTNQEAAAGALAEAEAFSRLARQLVESHA
jgi:hypothetical protein